MKRGEEERRGWLRKGLWRGSGVEVLLVWSCCGCRSVSSSTLLAAGKPLGVLTREDGREAVLGCRTWVLSSLGEQAGERKGLYMGRSATGR